MALPISDRRSVEYRRASTIFCGTLASGGEVFHISRCVGPLTYDADQLGADS